MIYLFRHGNSNKFKIGKGDDPAHRKKQLQTGNPEKITLVASAKGGLRDEAYLQQKYIQYKIRIADNEEWHEFPPDVLEQVLEDFRKCNEGLPWPVVEEESKVLAQPDFSGLNLEFERPSIEGKPVKQIHHIESPEPVIRSKPKGYEMVKRYSLKELFDEAR